MIGSTIQENQQTAIAQAASNFASDALINDIAAATTIKTNVYNNSQYKYNAVYGRLGYNWADKYLLNLTGRRDGSSRFGPGYQFGDFGAVGAGYIFSKERFIQNSLPFLSFGKIRGSYGTTGNDQITDYQYLSSYSSNNLSYQSLSGLQPTRIPNPYYRWELVKKLEFGLGTGLFKG